MSRLIRLESTEGVFGPTLQGEGVNIGVPCAFVRLYGCDFRCTWCDTPFALGKDKGGSFEEVTAQEIFQRLKALKSSFKWVVLSGGNPLAQGRNLDLLFMELVIAGYEIQVETQGSIAPTYLARKHTDFWSISPKLPSAGLAESGNWSEVTTILDGMFQWQKAQLKFVVADFNDYTCLKARLFERFIDPKIPIILQPEGLQHEEGFNHSLYWQHVEQLFDWVKCDSVYWSRYDVRILPTMHKLIWGKERKR